MKNNYEIKGFFSCLDCGTFNALLKVLHKKNKCKLVLCKLCLEIRKEKELLTTPTSEVHNGKEKDS